MCFSIAYLLAQESESAKKGIIETMYSALQKRDSKKGQSNWQKGVGDNGSVSKVVKETLCIEMGHSPLNLVKLSLW